MKNTNKSIFENYPDVVTVEQLASMLGISTKTAYKLVKEKQIKSVCIGRIYKIPKNLCFGIFTDTFLISF